MPTRISNPVYLTILNPVDPNLARIFKKTAPVLEQEILQPFQIDSGGGIAIDTDPIHRLGQHIVAALLTGRGERVMRPTYGVGVQRDVFESNDFALANEISLQLRTSLAMWEPEANIIGVRITRNDQMPEKMDVAVSFSLVAGTQPHTVTFALDGTRVEI